jgi:hypothetical protein
MKVAGRQVKQFLNASAGVIEHAEEYIVTFSVLGQTIDLCQQVAKFLLAQIAQNRAERFFGGDGQNRAAQSSQRWLAPCDKAKEGLNRRQPCISRPSRVAPTGFQISQEIQDQWTSEILDSQLINGTSAPRSGKLQQQLHRIPVGRDRMRADTALGSEITQEESR